MNIWAALKRPHESVSPKSKGVWARLVAQTDLSFYTPQKINLIEEKKLESKRAGEYFVVKNQEKARYLKLSTEDYFLWQKIDGETSFSDLVMSYFKQFGSFAFNRIHGLIEQLRRNHFLDEKPVRVFSQLTYLSQSQSFSAKVSSLFRSFLQKEVPFSNLDKWVSSLYKGFIWIFFTRMAKWLYLLISLFGVGCFVQTLHSGEYSIIKMEGSYLYGILVMVLLQGFIILIHEGAHAFAAKSYGREVPRGGFMLYMGMPAFFVDTTDMWLENKKKRIAVSWAGPYSELVLAGLFGLFMMFSPESALNPILFKCTFLFYFGVFLNLNPLLELDGYYMLVDQLEIPMLRRRSFQFVRKDLWKKIKAKVSFTANEKIFTVFGLLAGGYTLFAITAALYFWQTRIFSSMTELWSQGMGSQIVVVLLVLASLGPILLFLFFKAIKLVKWGADQITSNPVFKKAHQGTLVVLAVLAGFVLLAVNQPWLSLDWVRAGVALTIFLTIAHFLFWYREKIYPKSPWTVGVTLFVIGSLFFVVAEISSLLNQDFSSFCFTFSSVLFVLAIIHSLVVHKLNWATLLLLTANRVAAHADRFPNPEVANLIAGVLVLAAGLSFVILIQSLTYAKSDSVIESRKGDEDRLEAAFLGVLEHFKQSIDNTFCLFKAKSIWKKVDKLLVQQNLINEKGKVAFDPNLSILEKSKVASKVFESAWVLMRHHLGDKWAQLFLNKFMDSLDWQEREILEQYLFEGKELKQVLSHQQKDEHRNLEAILNENFLFDGLSEEEILKLSKVFEFESYNSDELIISQGEMGDKFYLIKKGSVGVRIKNAEGLEQEVATLSEGDFFGEIALLKEVPRTATCWAKEGVEVWSLDKESFTHYVKERFSVSISVERAIEILRLLKGMPLFKEFSPTQLRKLASSFQQRVMTKNEVIISIGEPGDAFFVIEKGACRVKIKGSNGQEQEVASLGKGEYFGEIALLSDSPRTATVEAQTDGELLVLSKTDFDQMLLSSLSMGSIEKVSSRRKLDLKKKTKLSIAEG